MTKLHETFFHIILYSSYILYFLAYIGLKYYDPSYLALLDAAIKYYIIFFLMIRFNPISKNTSFTPFDRQIVFSSAVFLFASSTLHTITYGVLDDLSVSLRKFLPLLL
jgi:hypothetical protein